MEREGNISQRLILRLLKWVGWIVAICGLFVLWALHDLGVRKSFAPASPDITFREFLKGPHAVALARTFESGGKQYVEVLGEFPKSAFYAGSGAPAYVFDATGRLVDWTPDRGDAPRYLKKWGEFSVGRQIDVNEVIRLHETNAIINR